MPSATDRSPDQDPGQALGQDPGRTRASAPGQDPASAPGRTRAPAPGQDPAQAPDRHPGQVSGRDPARVGSGRPVRHAPAALVPTAQDLRDAVARHGAPGRNAVVMTMGALHEGHATLIRAARARVGADGFVVVTVFVNPLQFGAGEDLDRYPRTLDADLELAFDAGASVVFAPSADEVYPGGEPQVRITAGPMGERLEGASRPGHFDGMLTVVAKLLHLTAPDLALFGQKDAQQLALIRRMVRDLNFPVEVVGVETVREDDGLALSSRNRYLSAGERRTALALSRALFAGRERLAAQEALRARADALPNGRDRAENRAEALSRLGEARAAADAHAVAQAAECGGPGAVRAAARAVLDEAAGAEPPLTLDYLALVDPADFTEVADDHEGDAVLAVAARVGTTRLIDNIPLSFGPPSPETPTLGATK
ncbi:pantoate--beta-alanine ligase [Streptomyces sp. NPDC093088]|uniref:pantoate--beta-alanine ligase n=2 Tax=unclassified Streptomyces TaxID=2593676 RepID=UPI0037FB0046